jgi:tetratricopeptide (TPR) repeat protein
LANALAETGQVDEAQSRLEECERLEPNNLAILKTLGDFYLRRGKLDEAQQAFTKATYINPRFVPARMGQGDVWVAKKELDQALVVYQAAIPFAANPATALIKIGIIHEIKGHWGDAEQAYRNALAAEPKSALAANNLAWLLNEHEKKPAEALTWAEKAAALAPKDANCQDTLGWILLANRVPGRALLLLKKANTLAAETNPQILYHLGVAYQGNNQTQGAVNALSKALELSKKFDGAKDAQARLDVLRSSR